MVFREFDEDDLDSYLEGSVWSEKPSAGECFSDYFDAVVTVFPSTSHSNMAFGYPAKSCETVFASRRPPSAYSSSRYEDPYLRPESRNHYDRVAAQFVEHSLQPISRPGSPTPVAGAGDITNTEHGFTIQLDVNRFRPEEIKVVLTDDLLTVSGERLEYTGDGQTLRRSFSRKYSIPSDISLDSIRSHLTDAGYLVVNGSRKGWRETSITTHPAPAYRPYRTSSVISTV
ncbi:unnamed protein product [Caenorhabditis auriculariae]|uniref:SHSP domain-containing protein n=1 Tax=Caenorhabditis auriculariae TaxID=2777116 RepID=A0A8S1H8Z1_9PELO|nr:unnamed protein product [Caenorhabditis auriculariae]